MSLPSYVINWEEANTSLTIEEKMRVLGTLRDLDGTHKIKGTETKIPHYEGKYLVFIGKAEDVGALMEISYNQSSYHPLDYWEVWVGGDRIFETIYTRELGVVKHWEVVHYLTNQLIRVYHHNVSGTSKNVWVDLGYTGRLNFEAEEGDLI